MFKFDFLENNEDFVEQMLFLLFDLFFHIESPTSSMEHPVQRMPTAYQICGSPPPSCLDFNVFLVTSGSFFHKNNNTL